MKLNFLYHFGRYIFLIKHSFSKPEKFSIYWKEFFRQMVEIGISSLPIVIIISLFLGAVLTVQTAYQFTSPLLSKSIIGSIVTNSTILEMAPTVTCLILAGKIGSSISSELGTMRISEQIDALEIMGINSASYLVMPKVLATTLMIPLLVIVSGFLIVVSGILVGDATGALTKDEFLYGAVQYFDPFTVKFAIVKAFSFGFIISSISAYMGYYTEGGSFEVGKSATKSVVICCIMILISDYLIAALML